MECYKRTEQKVNFHIFAVSAKCATINNRIVLLQTQWQTDMQLQNPGQEQR